MEELIVEGWEEDWERQLSLTFKGEFPYGVPNDLLDFIRHLIRFKKNLARNSALDEAIEIIETTPYLQDVVAKLKELKK
jgi:hypothetical protein